MTTRLMRELVGINIGNTGPEVWDNVAWGNDPQEVDEFGSSAGVDGVGNITRDMGSKEDEDDDNLRTTKKPGGARDLMVSTTINVLCYARNQQVNAFQGINAYFNFASNTSKRTMEVNKKLGFGVTYEATVGMMVRIGEASKESYMVKARKHPYVLFFDNMNYMVNVKTVLLSNRAHMKNYTVGYVYFTREDSWKRIIGSAAGDIAGCFLPGSWINRNIEGFSAKDIVVRKTMYEYLKLVSRVHVIDVLKKYHPISIERYLQRLRKQELRWKAQMGKEEQEGVIDQSVASGIAENSGNTRKRKLRDVDANIRRLDSLSKISAIYELPVQMTDINTLPIIKLNEAVIFDMIQILKLLCEEIGLEFDSTLKEVLIMVKGDWLTVRNIVRAIYERIEELVPVKSFSWIEPVIGLFHLQMNVLHMNMSAHWGRVEDPGLVQRFVVMLGHNRVDSKAKDFRSSNQLYNELLDAHILAKLTVLVDGDLDGRIEAECLRKPSTENWGQMPDVVGDLDLRVERDFVYENTSLFIQHGLIYREYTSAVKAGDPGRIQNILEVWETHFQATGQMNYGQEMIHMMFCLRRGWSEQFRRFWMEHCLSQTMDSKFDIQKMQDVMIRDSVFEKTYGRNKWREHDTELISQSKDLYNEGMARMLNGVPIAKYVRKCCSRWSSGVGSYMDTEQGEEIENEDQGEEGFSNHGIDMFDIDLLEDEM
ncbi:hypothetical protein EV426DRAFT_578999 [Tirmania nivea]|nr:hypothetical protein EV426DRAFT_578999 [Tirmania nivea]